MAGRSRSPSKAMEAADTGIASRDSDATVLGGGTIGQPLATHNEPAPVAPLETGGGGTALGTSNILNQGGPMAQGPTPKGTDSTSSSPSFSPCSVRSKKERRRERKRQASKEGRARHSPRHRRSRGRSSHRRSRRTSRRGRSAHDPARSGYAAEERPFASTVPSPIRLDRSADDERAKAGEAGRHSARRPREEREPDAGRGPPLLSNAMAVAGESQFTRGASPLAGEAKKGVGRPRGPKPPTSLSVPEPSSRTGAWVSTISQMDAIDTQLQAGVFIQAWVESQPSIPLLKQASVALFYVLGRKDRDGEGIDVTVRLVAARAPSLLKALEDGPFPSQGIRDSALHLCATEECVLRPGPPGITRVHTVAIHVLLRAQLSEAWYKEGVTCLDDIIEKDTRYPRMAIGPVMRSSESGHVDLGPILAAQVGGGSSRGRPAGSTLGLVPGQFPKAPKEQSFPATPPRPNEEAGIRARERADAEDVAARRRQEAFSLEEARRVAEEKVRELHRKTEEVERVLRRQAAELAGMEARREAAKADRLPSHSRASKQEKERGRKRQRSPSHKSRGHHSNEPSR